MSVQIHRLSIKIFARQSDFDQEPLIGIFHRWIRDKRLGEVVYIDVADYRHVSGGPGVMLINHDAHYSLDTGNDKLGLVYARKRDPLGDIREKLQSGFGAVLGAALALEGEPELGGQLSFDPARLEIGVLDRLLAPNIPAAYEAMVGHLEEFLATLYPGSAPTFKPVDDAREPLTVRVHVPGDHTLREVFTRLG